MATKTSQPGQPDAAPIESRRAPAAADVGHTSPDQHLTENGEGSVIDLPDFGSLSAEAARPTPLDDIARSERGKAPRD